MSDSSIFRPSFGNRPDRIVGRGAVIDGFIGGLSSFPGSRERATLLIGQRGMGKTALLLEMADRAWAAGFVPVRVTCSATMLDTIVDLLQREGTKLFSSKNPPVKGFSAGAFGFSFGLTFNDEVREAYGFRVKLEMLCERLAEIDKGVLILVDEVQPSLDEMRQLVTTYQELVGDNRNIAIVMAGLPAVISELLEQDTLTFLNRAAKIELGPVSIAEVRSYYASAFRRSGRRVASEVLDEAAAASEGFPYLLQLMGYYLTEYTGEGDEITRDVLVQAERSSYNDLDENVFRAMLRPLSDADIAFLRAMSRDDGPTKVGDLEGRLGVSQGHVQSYRKRLIDAGVVVVPRRGELEFVIPRLKDYLRR